MLNNHNPKGYILKCYLSSHNISHFPALRIMPQSRWSIETHGTRRMGPRSVRSLYSRSTISKCHNYGANFTGPHTIGKVRKGKQTHRYLSWQSIKQDQRWLSGILLVLFQTRLNKFSIICRLVTYAKNKDEAAEQRPELACNATKPVANNNSTWHVLKPWVYYAKKLEISSTMSNIAAIVSIIIRNWFVSV